MRRERDTELGTGSGPVGKTRKTPIYINHLAELFRSMGEVAGPPGAWSFSRSIDVTMRERCPADIKRSPTAIIQDCRLAVRACGAKMRPSWRELHASF
jgi:hypothetical protein